MWTDRQSLWTAETPCGMEWVAMALSAKKESEVQTGDSNGDYH